MRGCILLANDHCRVSCPFGCKICITIAATGLAQQSPSPSLQGPPWGAEPPSSPIAGWKAPNCRLTRSSDAHIAADFAEKNAAELCALAFETLPSYTERTCQRAVNATLEAALKNATFLKHFAGGLLKQAPAATTPQARLQRMTAC